MSSIEERLKLVEEELHKMKEEVCKIKDILQSLNIKYLEDYALISTYSKIGVGFDKDNLIGNPSSPYESCDCSCR